MNKQHRKETDSVGLNPIMQEAVHAEIVKLLDNGIIYPILDSQWVNPKETRFHHGGKREQRVSPNSTSHENSSLH